MMMQPFRNWSIRHKLITLFMAMALCTAIMVCLPLGIFDFVGLKRAMARDQAALADALARNSTAALTFQDSKSAADTLQALRAEPSVTAACPTTARAGLSPNTCGTAMPRILSLPRPGIQLVALKVIG